MITAYDGESGYQTALDQQPDLVTLTLMLPTLSGYTMSNRLKEQLRDLLVIMHTAKSQDTVYGRSRG